MTDTCPGRRPDLQSPEPKDCPACGASNASVCAHHENERPEGCINTNEVIEDRIARIPQPTEGGERYVVERIRHDEYAVIDTVITGFQMGIRWAGRERAEAEAARLNAIEAQHTQSILAAERERVVSVVEINGAIQDYISNSGDAVPGSLLKLLSDLDWSLTQQEATNE